MDDHAWQRLARDLGLRGYGEQWGSLDDGYASFRVKLGRRSGPPATDLTMDHLLVGAHGGARVILQLVRQHKAPPQIVFTVEVAPSLGLRAFISSPRSVRGLINPSRFELGHPAFDAELCLEADDPPRLVELLYPQSEADATLLRTIISDGLSVTDTTVCTSIFATATVDDGVPFFDAPRSVLVGSEEVRHHLDRLVWVAREVAARRRRVRVPPEVQQRHAAWHAAATSRRFAFDADAGVVHGEAAGAQISIGLETRLKALHVEGSFEPFSTYVTASFHGSLGMSLRVERSGMLNKVWEIFGSDIVVGDKAFDSAFSVKGRPEEAVRERLRPAAAALVEAHGRTVELALDDEGLFMLVPGIAATRDELTGLIDLTVSILTGMRLAPPPAPYR